jgi:anti-anti-sigma factor
MNATEEILQVERHDEVLVLTPRRNLRELEYREIEEELLRVADDPAALLVVVDFGHTDYFGSTALGMLTLLCQRVRGRGGRVAFCNLSAHEREIVAITGLNELWPICGSREEALQEVTG